MTTDLATMIVAETTTTIIMIVTMIGVGIATMTAVMEGAAAMIAKVEAAVRTEEASRTLEEGVQIVVAARTVAMTTQKPVATVNAWCGASHWSKTR
jgi:hypothetical protein